MKSNSKGKTKKNKKISTGKVKNKLILSSIIAVLIPLIALGGLSYLKSFNILKDKLTITTEQMVHEVNSYVDEYLSGIERQVLTLSNNSKFGQLTVKSYNIEGTITNNTLALKDVMELLKNVNNSNPSIINTYFGTVDGKMYLYPEVELPEGYDPRTREWYTLATGDKGNVIWTNPYIDANSNDITISSARTVTYNGKVVGVIGVDIDLKKLSETLSKKTVGREGYVFVTDNKGIMIAHPDANLIGSDDPTQQSFWENVSSNEKGFENYTYEGKEKFLSYITNNKTGWKLIASLENSELLNDTKVIRNFTIYTVLFGSLLAISLAIFIALGISRPLNTLKECFAKAATGDMTVSAKITSKDEFGEIGESFNSMIKNISLLINEIQNSSNTVYESSNSLAEITEQTAASTNEIAVTIEEIAKSASEQAKDTENGAIQIRDLASKIETVENTANNIDGISIKTNQFTDEGLEKVKLLTEKSRENKESSIKVNEIVMEVDKSSEEIGTITETIGQIAEQTNLLALNAAIEAARAGEHGKGFAVVAEEVRKLAEESSAAAAKVKELIEEIQNKSKIAVKSIEEAKLIAEANDKAVEETELIFSDISNSIKELVNDVMAIKQHTFDMTNKKNEIIGVIENLSASSEETSAATQQVSAATEEQLASIQEVTSHSQNLKSLANKLQEAISKFKVNNS